MKANVVIMAKKEEHIFGVKRVDIVHSQLILTKMNWFMMKLNGQIKKISIYINKNLMAG